MSVGDIKSIVWVFSKLGIIMSTLADTKMHVGVTMSTPGGCSVHQRDTMSTQGDSMGMLGDFGTNDKSYYQISKIFVLAPFATVQMYMLAFGTSDSLLKFLYQVARAQTLTHFFVSSLIKSL